MFTAIRHPYTAAAYHLEAENRIRVTHGGRSGIFDHDGVWLEGEVKTADPCFCRWIASEWIVTDRRRLWGRAYK